jgi:hypothetical protein
MEQKTSRPDEQIAKEYHYVDGIVPIDKATPDALESQIHKQQIRKRVDNLSRIQRDNIILAHISLHSTSLHTNSPPRTNPASTSPAPNSPLAPVDTESTEVATTMPTP